MISRSGLAPMVFTARLKRCTSPVTLVTVPFFSYAHAAGSTTSATCAVSVKNNSCTTTNPARRSPGPRNGFAPTTHSTLKSASSISSTRMPPSPGVSPISTAPREFE